MGSTSRGFGDADTRPVPGREDEDVGRGFDIAFDADAGRGGEGGKSLRCVNDGDGG